MSECDIFPAVSAALKSAQPDTELRALRLFSALLPLLTADTQTELTKGPLMEQVFALASTSGPAISHGTRRELVYCFACMSSFDAKRLARLAAQGMFRAMNAIVKETKHSFAKALMLAGVCAMFAKARAEGYSCERELAKHYFKAGGLSVIQELERSAYKAIRLQVLCERERLKSRRGNSEWRICSRTRRTFSNRQQRK